MKERIADNELMDSAEHVFKLLDDLGFTCALEVPFTSPRTNNAPQRLLVFANPANGCVVKIDTWTWPAASTDVAGCPPVEGVNTCELHYCWKYSDWKTRVRFTSSGCVDSTLRGWRYLNHGDPGYEGEFWRGYHDARRGLRHKMRMLADNGEFLKQWPATDQLPSGLFVHWGDIPLEHGRNFYGDSFTRARLMAERYALTPAWFQQIVNLGQAIDNDFLRSKQQLEATRA